MGDVAGFNDPLSRAQMPPQVGIGGRACRHRQQTETEDPAKSRRLLEIKVMGVSRAIIESGSCWE